MSVNMWWKANSWRIFINCQLINFRHIGKFFHSLHNSISNLRNWLHICTLIHVSFLYKKLSSQILYSNTHHLIPCRIIIFAIESAKPFFVLSPFTILFWDLTKVIYAWSLSRLQDKPLWLSKIWRILFTIFGVFSQFATRLQSAFGSLRGCFFFDSFCVQFAETKNNGL